MNQACLNGLMTLHIHKDKTDNLPLDTCLNDFVAGNEHRLTLFGTFQIQRTLLSTLLAYVLFLYCAVSIAGTADDF